MYWQMDILSNRALQTGNWRHAFVTFLQLQPAASARLRATPKRTSTPRKWKHSDAFQGRSEWWDYSSESCTQGSGWTGKSLLAPIRDAHTCLRKQARCSQSGSINAVACAAFVSFPGRLQHRRIIATKFKTAMFKASRFSLCPQNSHKLLSTCYINTEKHTEVLKKTPETSDSVRQ